jgi:hypothetical protein
MQLLSSVISISLLLLIFMSVVDFVEEGRTIPVREDAKVGADLMLKLYEK